MQFRTMRFSRETFGLRPWRLLGITRRDSEQMRIQRETMHERA